MELLFDCKELEELDTPWLTFCFFKPLVAVLLQSTVEYGLQESSVVY